MAKTGSINDLVDALIKETYKATVSRSENTRSKTHKNYQKNLANLASRLREGASIGDPGLSLKLEEACIRFESENFIVTQKDRDRIEKNLTQNVAAEKSLEFLKTNPDGYREKIQEALPKGINKLPEGDAYITYANAQIKILGQAQSWTTTSAETNFFVARQENLKAGRKGYQELQRNALFPPPGQNKKQTGAGDKTQVDDISAAEADKIQRDQKFLLEAEKKYDSSLKLFLDAKKQEMNIEIAKVDKAIGQVDKKIADEKKKKPAVFGKKEWERNLQTLLKHKGSLEKQKTDMLEQQKKMSARLTEEFRKNNPELTKNRDLSVKNKLEQAVALKRKQTLEKSQSKKISRKIS